MKSLNFAIALFLAAAASAAGAQDAVKPDARLGPPAAGATTPPVTVPGVTVTARRPHSATLEEASRQYVESHVVEAPIAHHLLRWQDPICPMTAGLPAAYNAFISQRVLNTAKAIGAPVADPHKPCRTNVLIVFTTEPQAYLDEIATKHPQLLGWHYASQTHRLKSFNHPIESWYVTASKTEGGDEQVDSVWGNGENVTPYNSTLVRALIVVDWNKAQDFEVGTIGDYVAMLTLSQPHRAAVATCNDLASILDLLSDNCAETDKPKGLTEPDLAFLKALYDIDPRKRTEFARQAIARRVVDALKH
ncbi:MAG TPA: hypothetical protein VGL66_12085 [Caulobacteraceae bacterium]